MKESLQLELKKSFGKDAITTLVAFANSEGGRLIVGIGDDGVVCGVEIGAETLQRYINEVKVATYPQIIPKAAVEVRDGKQIIVFEAGDSCCRMIC